MHFVATCIMSSNKLYQFAYEAITFAIEQGIRQNEAGHFLTCYQPLRHKGDLLPSTQDATSLRFPREVSSDFRRIKLKSVFSIGFPIFISCFIKHHTIASDKA